MAHFTTEELATLMEEHLATDDQGRMWITQRPIAIKNIESGWHGQIIATEGEGADMMLVCKGINWLTGTLDEDDTQWHSPFDVVRVPRNPNQSAAPNPLSFL